MNIRHFLVRGGAPVAWFAALLMVGLVAACGDDSGGGGDDGPDGGAMGDGDGDSGDGDGDGDSGDGDGDGDGDSGDGDSDGGAGDGDGDGDGVDPGAPTIVSTFPEDGAVGVEVFPTLQIVFSEAMDQASVEAALQTPGLPTYTTSWNPAGTILELTLNGLLDYGDDANTVTYDITIGTGAEDAEGTPLSQDETFSFATLRRLTMLLPLADPSGMYTFNAMTVGANLYIGDDVNNDSNRVFLTFDIAGLPDAAQNIQANLRSYQESVAGSPYTDLDSGGNTMAVYEQTFSDVGTTTSGSAFATNLCEDDTVGPCSGGVTDEVRTAFDEGRMVQFVVGSRSSRTVTGATTAPSSPRP